MKKASLKIGQGRYKIDKPARTGLFYPRRYISQTIQGTKMDDFLSNMLDGMVGEWEEIICKEVEQVDENTCLCHLILKVEPPRALSVMVSFNPRAGTLSASVLLGIERSRTSVWQIHEAANVKLHLPGSGYIGKLCVRPTGYSSREGLLDLTYSWEMGISQAMMAGIDLKVILIEQIARLASEALDMLTHVLSGIPGQMH